ncbi:hypothetical protein BGX27_007375 [Mortierella sp. AM989]|nr:hypothetical protein BGX27_007375 [Mortierella sp. AM989]
MSPTTRATASTKRNSSPTTLSESPTKRSRKSSTKDKENKETIHPQSKQKQSKHVRQSPEAVTEEKTENEPEDDNVKAEETDSSAKLTENAPASEVKSEPQQEEVSAQRVIEKGHAFFFYRPKIDVDKPSGADDIQKFYILLSPDEAVGRPATEDKVGQLDISSKPSHDDKPNHRLLIIPKKTLPSPGKGIQSRTWAFVDETSADLDEVEKKLERYTYSTKTRGERTQESARLIGEARYNIIIDRGHSHFIYELEVPQQPNEVQQAFNISKEGQFVMQVKNPEIQTAATERGQARYATLGEGAAKLPKHLQEKFRGIRQEWVRHSALDSAEFLDVRHLEIGLYAVNKDAKEEFEELVKVLEEEVKEEEDKEIDVEKPEDHVYKELGLDEDKVPAAIDEFK